MPLSPHSKGVTLNVRLTPGARKNGIHGVMDIADGKRAFKISVTAVPEDGKANKALIDLLAKELKVPKSAIHLVSGETNRQKVLLVEGETAALAEKLRLFQ